LAVALHRRHAFHQFAKNISLAHDRVLLEFPFLRSFLASRAPSSASIAAFKVFFSFGERSEASSLSNNVINQISLSRAKY
jgi:hypothetical protein